MGSPLFATSALVGRASAGLAHAVGGRCVHDWRREKPVPEGNREMPWLRAEVHDVLLNPQVPSRVFCLKLLACRAKRHRRCSRARLELPAARLPRLRVAARRAIRNGAQVNRSERCDAHSVVYACV
jgi:hypothetical protein